MIQPHNPLSLRLALSVLLMSAACGGRSRPDGPAGSRGDTVSGGDDISTLCGNDTLDGSELCDGTAAITATCREIDSSFTGGVLVCNNACDGYVSDACTPRCGNGLLEPPEICDGTEHGTATCDSLGMGGGTLTCTATCTFEFVGCWYAPPVCGDNVAEAPEACDGSDLVGYSCAAMGFDDGGNLACLDDCSDYDTNDCAP